MRHNARQIVHYLLRSNEEDELIMHCHFYQTNHQYSDSFRPRILEGKVLWAILEVGIYWEDLGDFQERICNLGQTIQDMTLLKEMVYTLKMVLKWQEKLL